jgi:anti-sigma B factor antagonist
MANETRRQRLKLEAIGDITVVNFLDRRILDEQNIAAIGEQLFALVDDSKHRKVLLNFHNVEYLSSAALGQFIVLHKKLTGAGGKLVLCHIAPQIYEVFTLTRLDKVFNIKPDEDSALKAF